MAEEQTEIDLGNLVKSALDRVNVQIEVGTEFKVGAALAKRGWVVLPPEEGEEHEEPEGITPDQLYIAASYLRRFGPPDAEIGAWASERLAMILEWARSADDDTRREALQIASGEADYEAEEDQG